VILTSTKAQAKTIFPPDGEAGDRPHFDVLAPQTGNCLVAADPDGIKELFSLKEKVDKINLILSDAVFIGHPITITVRNTYPFIDFDFDYERYGKMTRLPLRAKNLYEMHALIMNHFTENPVRVALGETAHEDAYSVLRNARFLWGYQRGLK